MPKLWASATRALLVLLIGLLAGACAGLAHKTEPPWVSLVDIQPLATGVFEQRYRLTLRLQNPNDFDIPIKGLSYELTVNERPFVRGVSRDGAKLPALGETLVEVDAVSNVFALLEQIRRLDRSGGTLSYRLTGRVHVPYGGGPVPFAREGRLDLGGG